MMRLEDQGKCISSISMYTRPQRPQGPKTLESNKSKARALGPEPNSQMIELLAAEIYFGESSKEGSGL